MVEFCLKFGWCGFRVCVFNKCRGGIEIEMDNKYFECFILCLNYGVGVRVWGLKVLNFGEREWEIVVIRDSEMVVYRCCGINREKL